MLILNYILFTISIALCICHFKAIQMEIVVEYNNKDLIPTEKYINYI